MRLRTGRMRRLIVRGTVIAASLALLGAATPVIAGATTPPTGFMRWKFAFDLRNHPNRNPFPSDFGKPAAWSLRQSQSPHRDGNYRLLPFYASTFGSAGLKAWHGSQPGHCGRLPAIGVNSTDKSVALCSAHVPGAAAFVVPSATRMPVVSWTSPYDGSITISHDAVSDLDPTCGDGVSYFVDLGTTPLAAVTVANGGGTVLPSMLVPIKRGQSLNFIVSSGARNNSSCDTTQLQITIDGVVSQATTTT
jgi:hypothetical protein